MNEHERAKFLAMGEFWADWHHRGQSMKAGVECTNAPTHDHYCLFVPGRSDFTFEVAATLAAALNLARTTLLADGPKQEDR